MISLRRLAAGLLLLLLITGCARKKPPAGSTENPFRSYHESIRPVELPLATRCEEELIAQPSQLSNPLIRKFGVADALVHGKIAATDQYVAILYLYPTDILLPVLKITDSCGVTIDSLPFYHRWCGEDEHSVGTSWALITPDLTITLCDSAVTYRRDSTGAIIESSRDTVSSTRRFRISPDGHLLVSQ